jgi:hypothetical protein
MKLATEARSKKPSTALRMRSLGSILERSIVGGGGDFFDFFDLLRRRFVLLILPMMTVVVVGSWSYLSGVVLGD